MRLMARTAFIREVSSPPWVRGSKVKVSRLEPMLVQKLLVARVIPAPFPKVEAPWRDLVTYSLGGTILVARMKAEARLTRKGTTRLHEEEGLIRMEFCQLTNIAPVTPQNLAYRVVKDLWISINIPVFMEVRIK